MTRKKVDAIICDTCGKVDADTDDPAYGWIFIPKGFEPVRGLKEPTTAITHFCDNECLTKFIDKDDNDGRD